MKDKNIWWCNSHQREATHINNNSKHVCDPKLGGITLPCFSVLLDDVEIIEQPKIIGK